jgi:hypothetical protein
VDESVAIQNDSIASLKKHFSVSIRWVIVACVFALPIALEGFKSALMSALLVYAVWATYWGSKGISTLIPKGIILWLPLAGWALYWVLKWLVWMVYGFAGGGIYQFFRYRRMLKDAQSVRVV